MCEKVYKCLEQTCQIIKNAQTYPLEASTIRIKLQHIQNKLIYIRDQTEKIQKEHKKQIKEKNKDIAKLQLSCRALEEKIYTIEVQHTASVANNRKNKKKKSDLWRYDDQELMKVVKEKLLFQTKQMIIKIQDYQNIISKLQYKLKCLSQDNFRLSEQNRNQKILLDAFISHDDSYSSSEGSNQDQRTLLEKVENSYEHENQTDQPSQMGFEQQIQDYSSEDQQEIPDYYSQGQPQPYYQILSQESKRQDEPQSRLSQDQQRNIDIQNEESRIPSKEEEEEKRQVLYDQDPRSNQNSLKAQPSPVLKVCWWTKIRTFLPFSQQA